MRMYRLFLIPWIVFILCIAAVPSTLSQENLPAIVKKVEPSVVVIMTYDEEGEILVQGSGFFISKDGNVVTNRHVLQGAIRAEVKTADGNMYPVKRVLAEDGDLVIVSVEIPTNVVYPLSASGSFPERGERVIVIGSPLGLEQTVADGIVSAVREIPAYGKVIQITAPISEGSSGSPIVNMKGQVIGVATFMMVEGQNLNFAIPGERLARVSWGKSQTLAEREAKGIESSEYIRYTGILYIWEEDYEKALSCFEEAAKKNPQYVEAYLGIAYCNEKLGRYYEAIESSKQAIRIDPDCAEAHNNLCGAYYRLGRYQDAIEAGKQTIRINPSYAEAHYNLGLSYFGLYRYQDAIEAGKQAIRINPSYAEAHFHLGWVHLILGDRDSALREYKILKDLDKDLANKLFNQIYR